jgi:hypothetical protein
MDLKFNYEDKCLDRLDALGRKVTSLLVGHIDAQDLPWQPLAAKTIKLKGHDVIYVESKDYKKGINWDMAQIGKYQFELVIRPTGVSKRTNTSYEQIAKWLEYGVDTEEGRIPPRPLWRVVFEEMFQTDQFQRLLEFSDIRMKVF